jgi:MFS family permease
VANDVATVDSQRKRDLSAREKQRLALLGLPTFGLALAITIVSTYLPTVAEQFTSSTIVIGAIVGGEGVMALWVPLLVGPLSDQLRTRIGGRLPFLLGAVPIMALSLLTMGAVHSLAVIAVAASVFFVAYFVAYEPYRALYPDLVGDSEVAGRAQGTQAIWRGAGTGLALLIGGLLLSSAPVLPFAFAALVALAATGGFAWAAVRRGMAGEESRDDPSSLPRRVRSVSQLVARHPALRAYMLANALWEMALAALKVFVVLYLTKGLGLSVVTASLIVGGTGGIVLVGAAMAGKLGDRLGRIRVMRWGLWIYGLAFAVPLLFTSKAVVAAAAPAIALGGGVVMALPYALLMPLMPADERGALTGFYSVSRGIGITIGPVLAGGLISLTAGGVFEATQGFQAVWAVPCLATLASLPLLGKLECAADDRKELREQ